ncbi:MAG: putative N-acetylmannosamine-6-phosphate 2-epimerase [Cyanobacteria bacterium P01_D01_bin.123]
MSPSLERLQHQLVVSCQAEGASPFNSPEGVALFARAAVQGGAAGIRTEGVEKTRKIVASVDVPTIGLVKSQFPDGSVCITGSFADVEALLTTGCDIIAVDGTLRAIARSPANLASLDGPGFIRAIKQRCDCTVMADIDTSAAARACQAAGADCLSTTLSGYTPDTRDRPAPDLELLENLAQTCHVPIFAEGRYNSPELAAAAIASGAWAVVVGTAITRPATITSWFQQAIAAAP